MSLKPTPLQYAAAGAQLLPPLAALAGRKLSIPPRRWIALWGLALTVESVLARVLGLRGINNMWVSYTFLPLTSAMGLWALSYWQPDRTARLALRWAIPFVVLVSVSMTLVIENPRTFSLVAAPFHGVILLLAALWTFLMLGLRTETPMARHDWFWVTSGLFVYAGTTAAVQPLGWYFLAERVDLLHAVWNVSAGATILACLAIAWGVLCPLTPTSFSGSSSPPSLRFSSWPPDSASR